MYQARSSHLPLTDDTGTHNQRAILLDPIAFINLAAHLHRILKSTFSCYSIGTAGVNHYGPNALSFATAQCLPANLHRCRLKLVGSEHSGGRAWCLRSNKRQVRKAGVRRLDAHMSTRDLKALRVSTRCRDIALLGSWDGHVQWCGVASDLALEHASKGANRHCGGLRVGNHSRVLGVEIIRSDSKKHDQLRQFIWGGLR